jgi:urea transport system ATP-binding protein
MSSSSTTPIRQADVTAKDEPETPSGFVTPDTASRPIPTPVKKPGKARSRWLRLTSRTPASQSVGPDDLTAKRRAHLWVDNISKSFDGFKALNNLTLILDEGELRCIIGPNGAGKTTLMDCITGKTRPDTGNVYLIGKDRERISLIEHVEHEVAQMGIGRKFQRPTVFHDHSVFENLELAFGTERGVLDALWGKPKAKQAEKIEEILSTIGLIARRHDRAGLLSHGQKQWLEIGMLLAQDPRILLVDEPVAGMTHQETERTAELLKGLAGKHTVVVVEHDMDFVRSIASVVTVLHEGSVLAEGPMDVIQRDPKVIEVYLGE